MTRREHGRDVRRLLTTAADDAAGAPYLAPRVPEVAALLDAADRVLAACGRAEDAHADRTVRLAAAVDPCTLPLRAVVGPGLPVPLANRTAFRALQRLAVGLRPVLHPGPVPWPAPGEDGPVTFHALRVDTSDLAILEQAAVLLTHPRRRREGTLGVAISTLAPGGGEPADDRHPAALGCLLAVLVPVDPAALDLHTAAAVGTDAGTFDARREVGRRVLARLRRAR